MTDISHIQQFLACDTPQAWLDDALNNIDILLADHANCEKKAASTAINLMYRYVDHFELLNKMSRLAREELRHFEQVIAIMKKRGLRYPQLTAARYAGELRKRVRGNEPDRLVDTLIVGAIIEARSCERFAKLADCLDSARDGDADNDADNKELQNFYRSLLQSESRHYQDYLELARKYANGPVDERIAEFLQVEKALIEGDDRCFRFHSGPVNPVGDNRQVVA